ncbi:MAG: hypothetical protein ACM33V_06385 [Chloroflexota bacterium]|nr:hypothetical protein [Anaerolineales bacterium]
MKTILRIFDILLVAALIALAFSLSVDNISSASGLNEGGQPPAMTNTSGQPVERPDGDNHDSGSVTRGLSELLLTLGKLTGITILVLSIQKAFSMFGNRRFRSSQAIRNERKTMKRITLSILILAGFLLAACGTSATGTPLASTNNEIPIETRLAVGTLKLDGTAEAVTAEQAKELLILWKTYRQLSQSDTAAQAEVDGLVAQIQDTMTAEQVQAITAMQITQQDVSVSTQGVTVVSNSSGSNTSNASSNGGMQAGGPPPDGGGAPAGGGMSPEMGGGTSMTGTGQVQSAQVSLQSLTKAPSALVEAVIEALQQKTAAA